MNDEMALATWRGLKSHTCRPIKEANDKLDAPAKAVCRCDADGSWIAWWGDEPIIDREDGGWHEATQHCYPDGGGFRCPFGEVGDALYVRETWAHCKNTRDICDEYQCHSVAVGEGTFVAFRAGGDPLDSGVWRPNIHMPKKFARSRVVITSVDAKPIQSITEELAKREGVGPGFVPTYDEARGIPTTMCVGYRPMFAKVWDQLYGEGAFKANGWAWFIGFRKSP